MRVWLIKKSIYALLSLFTVVTLTFVLMKSIPGNPFMQEQALPKEIYDALLHHYGLDRSLPAQYWLYLKSLASFDFGPSLIYKSRSVNSIIREGFPISLSLGMAALALAIPLGLCAGIIAAVQRRRWPGKITSVAAVIGISMPSFIIAACLQYVVAIKLGLLPIARWGSLSQMILPAVSLALLPAAFISRLTRNRLVGEMRQEYIKTARAKGLPERIIIFRHALRNAIIPVIGYIGPLAANIFTGSFIVEKIYSIPGLGYWFVASVINRDYPVIMGITIFYCALVLLTSLVIDMLYAYLDPRIGAGLHAGRAS